MLIILAYVFIMSHTFQLALRHFGPERAVSGSPQEQGQETGFN